MIFSLTFVSETEPLVEFLRDEPPQNIVAPRIYEQTSLNVSSCVDVMNSWLIHYLKRPCALRHVTLWVDGWKVGHLCNVTSPPFNAIGDGTTDDTAALQRAIDACGNRTEGGTVLLPSGKTFVSGCVCGSRPCSIGGALACICCVLSE